MLRFRGAWSHGTCQTCNVLSSVFASFDSPDLGRKEEFEAAAFGSYFRLAHTKLLICPSLSSVLSVCLPVCTPNPTKNHFHVRALTLRLWLWTRESRRVTALFQASLYLLFCVL